MSKLADVGDCKVIVPYHEDDAHFQGNDKETMRRWGTFFMGRDLLEVGFKENGAAIVANGYQKGDYTLDYFSPDGKIEKREIHHSDGTLGYTLSVEYQPGNKVILSQTLGERVIETSVAGIDDCIPDLKATRALIEYTVTRNTEAKAIVQASALRA